MSHVSESVRYWGTFGVITLALSIHGDEEKKERKENVVLFMGDFKRKIEENRRNTVYFEKRYNLHNHVVTQL